jgi:hypothetical protein
MIHVRQGDTATMQTPWGTWMSLWWFSKHRYKQYPTFEELCEHEKHAPPIRPIDVFGFVEGLHSRCAPDLFSTLVFSDGYTLASAVLGGAYQSNELSARDVRELKRAIPYYEKQFFALFNTLAGTRQVIGEELSSLYHLIHSVLTCDVVVFTTQQQMIPGLLLAYGARNSPFLICLYRGSSETPGFYDPPAWFGPRYISVDVDSPDYDGLLKRLSAYLPKKWTLTQPR